VAKISLLNNEVHRNLKIITEQSPNFGDDVMWTPTFASEFRNIQAHYPILFQEDLASHELFPIALFGFEKGENLFLSESGWDASYIPLMIQRIPFSIGLYPGEKVDDEEKRLVNIDLDHPRVNTAEGEILFGEHGEESPYLTRISSMLEAIHICNKHSQEFMSAIVEFDLIEPVTMDIVSPNGFNGQLIGFYTINEDRLAGLEAKTLESLHKRDFLQPIYFALASLSNIRTLIEKKSIT
jgi:hypothetical protein